MAHVCWFKECAKPADHERLVEADFPTDQEGGRERREVRVHLCSQHLAALEGAAQKFSMGCSVSGSAP